MSLFTFIKGQVPIEDVVGSRVTLKTAGTYLKGSCPFHQENTASFSVSPDKGIYYCFGCQATGDVISFTAKIENIGQMEAARHLVEQYKLHVPEELLRKHGNSVKQSEEKKSFFAVCQFVAQWTHEQLKKHPAAYNYVARRGVSDEIRDLFSVGYLPGGVAALTQLAKAASQKGILVKDLIRAGVFYESRSVLKSPFEQRILFPITDTLGRYCGFGGRIFMPGDERAKYYNSKESEFFLKGHLLFGWTLAKKEIQRTKEVFLVEGYTDCVAMAQAGYANTVATLGTSCTVDHLKLLARNARVLNVLYDGDAAGIKAILRLTELCWQVNLEVRVIFLDNKHDPASYIEAHGSLDTPIAASQDIFTFYVTSVSKDFKDKYLAEQLQVVDRILHMIMSLNDVVKQELLLQRVSQALKLSVDVLRAHMTKLSGKVQQAHNHAQAHTKAPEERPVSEDQALETHIIAASMNSMVTQKRCLVPQDLHRYFSKRGTMLLGVIEQNAQRDSSKACFDTILAQLSQDDRAWLTSACMHYQAAPKEDEWLALIGRLLQQRWKDVVKDIRAKIARATQEGNREKVETLLERFSQLKQNIKAKGLI